MLIAELLTGRSLNDSLDEILAFLNKQKDAVETANALRKTRTAKNVSELGQGLNAEEVLAIGVYCVLKNTWDFKKAVLEAVNITGNRNSTWAIIGNIIGTINGEKSIPFECCHTFVKRKSFHKSPMTSGNGLREIPQLTRPKNDGITKCQEIFTLTVNFYHVSKNFYTKSKGGSSHHITCFKVIEIAMRRKQGITKRCTLVHLSSFEVGFFIHDE